MGEGKRMNLPRWHGLPAVSLIILAVTLLRALLLTHWPFGLYADESQYWFWAQTPDWGYYSKPPMVAWAIALTTAGCGDGVACVKLASPLAYGIASLFLYLAVRRLFDNRVAAWSSLLFLTIPGVTLSSTIISTDPFLLMFWSMALWAYGHAHTKNGWRWWLLAGVFAGLGMMSKYSFLFFGLSVLALGLWERPRGQVLQNPRFYAACLIALVLFLPNILWNAAHGWVSFQHTGDITQLEEKTILFHPLEMLEFLGAQAALAGPVIFLGFFAALRRWQQAAGDARFRFLLAFALPMLGLMLGLSLLTRAHGNWAAPAYVALVPLVAAFWIGRGNGRWLGAALAVNLLAAGVLYNYERVLDVTGIELTRKTDPFARVRGWTEAGQAVSALRAGYPEAGLLTERRKVSAQLIYHTNPHAFDLVQWNPNGRIQDHFELTTTLAGKEGRDFLYIAPSPAPMEVLALFGRYEALPPIVVEVYKGYSLTFDVYHAENFKGLP